MGLTKRTKAPYFHAHDSATSVPNAADTPVLWTTVAESSGGFSIASSRDITIPRAGLYSLSITLRFAPGSAATERFGGICRAGNFALRYAVVGVVSGSSAHPHTVTASTVRRLPRGEVVQGFAFQDSGAALGFGNLWTSATAITLAWVGD